jgi:hypothetical protein
VNPETPIETKSVRPFESSFHLESLTPPGSNCE